MKTLFAVLMLGLAGFSGELRAKDCPSKNYTLTTMDELALFGEIACTRVTGTLTIGEPNIVGGYQQASDAITNLNGLSNLESVHRLVIQHNSGLVSLTGLSKLSVIRNLVIEKNTSLVNLYGLSALERVWAIEIKDNPALIELSGIPNIRALSTYRVTISNNGALRDLNGLSNIIQLEALSIESNDGLQSLSGLQNLRSAGYSSRQCGLNDLFTVRSNSALADCSAVSSQPWLTAPQQFDSWDDYLCSLPGYNNPSRCDPDYDSSVGGSETGSASSYGPTDPYVDTCESFVPAYVENNAPGCNSIEEIRLSGQGGSSASTDSSERFLELSLEVPAVGATYSGISTLRGWAVAEEGISKVDIYIDGNFFQSAPYGGSRGDVGSIFPEINDSDESGFALAYNFSGLSAGTHTIKVEAVTTQGRVLSRTSQFQVTKFPAQFLPADQSPNLSGASCVINDQTVHILDTLVDGSVYDVSLEWRTADQGFQIQEIR